MKIGLWSTTAASNNTTPPDGWPEQQLPSTVNDCAREMMAAVRVYAQDAQWFDHGMSPTFVSTTTFTVPGDQSTFLMAGRALKLYDGVNTIFRSIATVSASANTNVILGAGTNITASLSSFATSILTPSNNGIPTSYNRISASAIEVGTLTASAMVCTNFFATNFSAASIGVTNFSAVVAVITGTFTASSVAVTGTLSASAIVANVLTVNGSGSASGNWSASTITCNTLNASSGIVSGGALRGQNGNPAGPSFIMDATDTDTGFYWLGDGIIGFATNNTQAARLSVGGFVAIAFTVTSDARTKADWEPIPLNMVEGLAAMQAGSFTRIKDGKRAVGVPAQDLAKLFPECVPMQADGTLLANYAPAAMVACVALATEMQELRAELELLKARK